MEYPEGYDPLTDSGKCWDEGKQQVRIQLCRLKEEKCKILSR